MLGPSGSKIALEAVEMAETAASDPARFVARDETTINLGEALELDTLRGELLKIPLRIYAKRAGTNCPMAR